MTGQIRSFVQPSLIGSMATESGIEQNLAARQKWAAREKLMPCTGGGQGWPPVLTGMLQQLGREEVCVPRGMNKAQGR